MVEKYLSLQYSKGSDRKTAVDNLLMHKSVWGAPTALQFYI